MKRAHANGSPLEKVLITPTSLQLFNPDRSVTINTNACNHPSAAVLAQDGRPIVFGPRKRGEPEKLLPPY